MVKVLEPHCSVHVSLLCLPLINVHKLQLLSASQLQWAVTLVLDLCYLSFHTDNLTIFSLSALTVTVRITVPLTVHTFQNN